jgi:hypothetical protein
MKFPSWKLHPTVTGGRPSVCYHTRPRGAGHNDATPTWALLVVAVAMVDCTQDKAMRAMLATEHIRQAIENVQYHVGEMLRIPERGAVDAEAEKAERLARWMRANPTEQFTLRQLCRRGPGPLRKADTLRGLLAMIERNGHVVRVGQNKIWRLSA